MYSFEEIIGHEKIKEHLQTAIKLNKISHAYIFVGEEGCGKKLMAKTFAKTLQCERKGIHPCGICKSCMQIESDNQPDIIVASKEKKNYAIAEIRKQIANDVQIKPYAGPYKIYIIPDAHTLREDSQNALLKTIEEPPEYAIIILLVNNISSMLPTILSRCVALNFKPIDKVKVRDYIIKECKVPDYAAEVSAIFSQGNIGSALKYANSEEFIEIKDMAIRMTRNLDKLDEYYILKQIKEVVEYKDKLTDFLDLLILWFRDMLICKTDGNTDKILFREECSIIKEQAQVRSYFAIDKAMDSINKAKTRLNANVNTEVVLEMMVLALKDKN